MKLAQSVRIGIWCLVGLNLLMAFVSVWFFVRMAPAIEQIINRNTKSIDAGQTMLLCLAEFGEETVRQDELMIKFENALRSAQNNITEKNETEAVKIISQNYQGAFKGDIDQRKETVNGISALNHINREAVQKADNAASRLGMGGAWGIVIMASFVFFIGLIYTRFLTRSLVEPLEEIHSVAESYRTGDNFRRCCGANMPLEITGIYRFINEMLDNGKK